MIFFTNITIFLGSMLIRVGNFNMNYYVNSPSIKNLT